MQQEAAGSSACLTCISLITVRGSKATEVSCMLFVCCWSDRRMTVGGSVECRRKFIVELKTVSHGLHGFLWHTAYRLWVTSHAFCSDSHTARPSAVYSSTFGFVIRFVSLRFDSCVTFPGAVSKCGFCTLQFIIDINIVG